MHYACLVPGTRSMTQLAPGVVLLVHLYHTHTADSTTAAIFAIYAVCPVCPVCICAHIYQTMPQATKVPKTDRQVTGIPVIYTSTATVPIWLKIPSQELALRNSISYIRRTRLTTGRREKTDHLLEPTA